VRSNSVPTLLYEALAREELLGSSAMLTGSNFPPRTDKSEGTWG